MANCEQLNMCPFFGDKMACAPVVAEMMKKRFCLGDSARCARYRVSRSGRPVPSDLFPNQADRVDRIIKK